jgi:hypothetical protein
MAFKQVQSSFVSLGNGFDPQTIPAHYGEYYDRAVKTFLKFGHYGGVSEIHDNFWPLICLLADQEKRIAALEAERDATATDADESTKEHWKTRQARERKEMAVT